MSLSVKSSPLLPSTTRCAFLVITLLALQHAYATDPVTQPAAKTGHAIDPTALTHDIQEILKSHGDTLKTSLWLGRAEGKPWYELDPDVPRPAASAIKTFFLVELFDRYKDNLDKAPPGVSDILKDDHPAISHFTAEQRDEVRRELSTATVRRIGQIMMGKTNVSNIVYNAGANVTTALLGGPEALTTLIHKRNAAFKGVAVRRYMLRDRKKPGDNEVTADSFAALYQRLAQSKLAGIDPTTMNAIREVLLRQDSPKLGRNYNKGGSLTTDPATQVLAGWWETPKGVIVYVVMTSQAIPEEKQSDPISDRLVKTVKELETLLVNAGRTLLGHGR